jgi:hypothetical protein
MICPCMVGGTALCCITSFSGSRHCSASTTTDELRDGSGRTHPAVDAVVAEGPHIVEAARTGPHWDQRVRMSAGDPIGHRQSPVLGGIRYGQSQIVGEKGSRTRYGARAITETTRPLW